MDIDILMKRLDSIEARLTAIENKLEQLIENREPGEKLKAPRKGEIMRARFLKETEKGLKKEGKKHGGFF